MRYKDRIYGIVKITDPVVVDIISSDAFQRLKGVDQAGYFEVYFPGTAHTRFEHSIGCYALLRRFGASKEEQLAGLIHDLSHSAFSHTADYVFASGRGADHNYQDDIFADFVQRTDIPHILSVHGYNPKHILDESRFPLQERQLPDLCADRIDYSLRGMLIFGIATKKDVANFLAHLSVVDKKWVFDSFEIADSYAAHFKKLNDRHYAGKETAAMFLRTSAWIKYARNKGYITHNDIFATDAEVIAKINSHLSSDKKLAALWEEMNTPNIILGKKDENNVTKVIVKSRIVDPLFKEEGNIIRVSEKNPLWKKTVRKDLEPKTYYIVTLATPKKI